MLKDVDLQVIYCVSGEEDSFEGSATFEPCKLELGEYGVRSLYNHRVSLRPCSSLS